MARPPAALPEGIPPRLLTRAQAAAYLNLRPDTFDEWRRQGRAPGPVPGTRRWDVRALDRMLDMLSGAPAPGTAASAYDDWKQEKCRGNVTKA